MRIFIGHDKISEETSLLQFSRLELSVIMSTVKTGDITEYNPKRASNKLPSKVVRDAAAQMYEDNDFNPLQFAIDVAKGRALTKDHPFLLILSERLTDFAKRTQEGTPIDAQEFLLLEEEAVKYLTDSWTSHELRAKFIMDLMQYVLPKRKAVEHTIIKDEDAENQAVAVSEESQKAFLEKFEKEY